MRDPLLPAPTPTPRTHPRVGDTYTDATGVARVLEGPDAHGNVKVRFPDGREFWTVGWGFWSAGTYARRDARHDPHVGDTKQYAAPFDDETYTVTSLEPFTYRSAWTTGLGRWSWESDSGMSCTWTCVEDVDGAS